MASEAESQAPTAAETWHGSCHCGAQAFTVNLEQPLYDQEVSSCNCMSYVSLFSIHFSIARLHPLAHSSSPCVPWSSSRAPRHPLPILTPAPLLHSHSFLSHSSPAHAPNSPSTSHWGPPPPADRSRFNLQPKRLPLHLPIQQEHHLDVRRPLPSLPFRSIHHPAPHPLHLQPRPHRPLLLLRVRHEHLRCEREARFLPRPHCSECEFFTVLPFTPFFLSPLHLICHAILGQY